MADLEEKPKQNVDEKKEDAEDDDGESSEEELGSLEKPIEILTTRRERKSVERLTVDNAPKTPKKEAIDYSKGRGVKLGEMDIVKYELDRTLASELKPLHKLLYKRDGKASMIKKNIRAFCGFPFEKDTKQYADLEWSMEKFTNVGLQRLCEIFGLDLKGKRDELKEKVLKFIMDPYVTEKKIPVKAKPKPKKPKKKSSTSSDEKPPKKKKQKEDANEDDAKEHEEDEEEKSDEDAVEDIIAEEEPEEKKSKKETGKEKKSGKNKVKKSKTTVIKLPTPSKKRKEKQEKPKKKSSPKKAKRKDPENSSDDEPLAKKAKSDAPSDETLEEVVKELLDGADLETVTMKMICKQVFEKFPGLDLTDRKQFIKETVKQIIS